MQLEQTQPRQPRSLDPRLANGVMQPTERSSGEVSMPQNLLSDLFQESREWRAEVKECRMEMGRVREAANTGTFLTGSGAGFIVALVCVALYVGLKR